MNQSRWLPLESNPDYVQSLGVGEEFSFTDVFGLDPELLAMIPRPVLGALLLFPQVGEETRHSFGELQQDESVYFMKQTINNACGTIGIIHLLSNVEKDVPLDPAKPLSKFLATTRPLAAEERGKYLEGDTDFSEAHEDSAQEGQTQAPARNDDVDYHFIGFVNVGGKLYELDGCKAGPIYHGPTSADTLLEDVAVVVKKFMSRDPDNMNFNLIAFTRP